MKTTPKDSRNFFYILLLFAGITSYLLLQPYLATVVFALVVVVMFRSTFDLFVKWCRGRKGLANTLTVLTIFLILLIPTFLVINITISQAIAFQQEIKTLVAGNNVSITLVVNEINAILGKIPYVADYQLTEEGIIEAVRGVVEPVATFLADKALSIGSSSAEWVAKLVIFLTIITSLFPIYPQFLKLVMDLSPLDDREDQKYIDRMTSMTKSMVKGVFIIAFVQGLITGLLLWIAGINHIAFWTLLAIFISILPMGAQLIAVPIGIILLMIGNIWQGVFLILGSVILVGNIDNILRPRLVSSDSELNPALLLLSAFGGLSLFGFLGIIYGPVTMIFLVTTVEIYLEHYR